MGSIDRDDLFRGVVQCLADSLCLEASTIRFDQSLRDDLGASSISLLDVFFELEQKYNIALKANDLRALSIKREQFLVSDLVDLVAHKISGG